MQRKTIIICLLMLPLLSAMAQGPNNSGTYYQNADGKKGAALKTALCGIIYNRTERSYSDLWTDFQKTDKRSDGKVWDMYSNSSNFVFCTHQDRGSGGKNEGEYYNREHSWPNSWFGGNVQPMYTDLHHIYPTDKFVNSKRSNYPLGETNGESYKSNNGFSKVGSCTYSGYTGTVFEPNDEYKGDFARTYFYMVTCYEEKLPDWYNNYSESQSTLDGSTYPGLSSWQLEMLMKWAKNDPVSEKEISRNNAVYDLQNNRNPFIDYPGLEEYIWGDKQDFAFSYDDDNSGVEVNSTNFPDEAFRNWVLQNVSGASDGILTDEEISKVTSIDCSGTSSNKGNISSLQGIEFFTALTYLTCDFNQLTTLDISRNTALKNLYCGFNQLTTLDVSKNTVLTDLVCGSNQLTKLDISNNTTLNKLDCRENSLKTLDVSKNTALTELYCINIQLTTLDISNNTALTKLSCGSNQLTTLDVSNNTALETLNCPENQIATLDISKNTALKDLFCYRNQLHSLDVSRNTALEFLQCGSNFLSTLNVSNNTALVDITCESNQLSTLDVSKNTALHRLFCHSNKLTVLDISKNTGLKNLNCSSNQLTKLELSNNTELNSLYCYSNQLTALDVSKNTALTYLSCSSNQLTSLDVSNNTALTYLYCYSSRLLCLNLETNTKLSNATITQQTATLTAKNVSEGIAIPVPTDFDFTKVSNLKLAGANANGSITTVDGQKYLVFAQTGTSQNSIDGKKLTYIYSTGNSNSKAASMDVTVNLSYTATTYSLSIQSGAGGSVSYDGATITNKTQSFTVNEGTSATITITPNTGYKLSKLTVNGTNVTSSVKDNKYTISSVSGNTTVVAAFEQITYTLSVQASGNGTVTYNSTATKNKTNTFTVNHGSSATLSIAPDSGYRLASLTVNGANVTSSVKDNQYTISSITANTTVVATFEQIPISTYSLSIQSGAGGSVSYDGTTVTNKTQSFTVNEGTSATITISPNTGYKLSKLTVNGTNVTSSVKDNKYTISSISGNTTVVATFEQITYMLSVQATGNGTVTYNSTATKNKTNTFTVNHGTSVTLSISPDSGYKLSKLTVNGTNVTSSVSNNQYTVSNITANTTVVATFEQIPATTYSLSIQSGAGGSVSYDGTTVTNKTQSFTVNEGTTATITVTPNNGYRLGRLTVNGTNVTSSVSNNRYTINSISGNTTVVASFEQIPITTYSLSIQSGEGGSVSYDGTTITNKTQSFTVNEGTSATITITPNTGYRLSRLTVNGTNVTSSVKDNQYTISSISGNTTVVATFEQIPATTYSLSIQSRSGGSVTYNETTVKNATQSFTVNEGVSATITITPDSGYRLASLTVNGTNVTSSVKNNQYTISNITTNTTVVATFEEIPATTFSLSIQSGSGGSVVYDGTTITNKTQSFTVAEGTSATITISPNTGCKLSILTVNGTNVTSNVKDNQYTISSIAGNTTVVATFEQITYTLSVQATGNGTVTYNSTGTKNTTHSFTVNHGSSATLSITPDSGYRLASLTVNGTNVTSSVSNNQYTISNITANTTVVATFEQIPATTYSLSIQSGAGGSVSFNGTTVTNTTRQFTVEEGTSATMTISSNSGYRLSSLTVNGTNVTSDVKDNQYTISNITGNTTVVVTFKAIPQSITQDGINYVLASAADYTLNVGRGDYSGHVIVPATINYDGDTWTVAGVVDGAFNLSAITAITWNPSTAIGDGAFGTQTNPNLLLYVKTEAYAPSNVQNVIANGRAKKIILTEAASGNDFNCPESFTAEEISYTHKYGMTTGINECRGWETIALPFTVQKVTHQTKGQLVTFKQWDQSDSAKPYWLYKLTYTGFVEADFIEANTPYVISMPNNDTYYADYILAGTVTFSAENATVKSSENLVTTSCNDKTFKPCFAKSSQNGIYAINAVNDWTTAVGGFKEGSVFVENLRPVMPFEAYMTTNAANAKGFIPIFETLPTAIRDIPTQGMSSTKGVRIYTLSGQLVLSDENITIDEALKRLKRGVYFVNGKKIVIRKEAF